MFKEILYISIFFIVVYLILATFIKYITDKVLERRFKKLKEDDKRKHFKTRKQAATEPGTDRGTSATTNNSTEQSRILSLSGFADKEPDSRGVEVDKTTTREAIFKRLGLN